MQVVGGLAEAGTGGAYALSTGGWGALAGGSFLIGHGFDNICTGARQLYYETPVTPATIQFLEKTGMPTEYAYFAHNSLSLFGTMALGALAKNAQAAAFPALRSPLGLRENLIHANEQILFGQKSISAYFSDLGSFKGKSISEVVQGLRNGTISPESLPIEIIVRNGQKITLNNRSLLALRRAGVNPKIIIDRTGIEKYELWLNNHLKGNLPSDVIKIRGGPPGTSFIGPIE
jgi:hypothetical protein